MLVIRMQRVGRSVHAQFRIVVQNSRQTPTSGKFVALLGSYNPHTKAVQIDKVAASQFIKNGAQPSERAALLLKKEGIKLPDWVSLNSKKSGALRNPDKLRKNRPADAEPKEDRPAAEGETPEEPTEETPAEEASTDTPAEEIVAVTAEPEESAPIEEESTSDDEPVAEPAPGDAPESESIELIEDQGEPKTEAEKSEPEPKA